MLDFFRYDFDYAWPWTYGHLIAAVAFAMLARGRALAALDATHDRRRSAGVVGTLRGVSSSTVRFDSVARSRCQPSGSCHQVLVAFWMREQAPGARH